MKQVFLAALLASLATPSSGGTPASSLKPNEGFSGCTFYGRLPDGEVSYSQSFFQGANGTMLNGENYDGENLAPVQFSLVKIGTAQSANPYTGIVVNDLFHLVTPDQQCYFLQPMSNDGVRHLGTKACSDSDASIQWKINTGIQYLLSSMHDNVLLPRQSDVPYTFQLMDIWNNEANARTPTSGNRLVTYLGEVVSKPVNDYGMLPPALSCVGLVTQEVAAPQSQDANAYPSLLEAGPTGNSNLDRINKAVAIAESSAEAAGHLDQFTVDAVHQHILDFASANYSDPQARGWFYTAIALSNGLPVDDRIKTAAAFVNFIQGKILALQTVMSSPDFASGVESLPNNDIDTYASLASQNENQLIYDVTSNPRADTSFESVQDELRRSLLARPLLSPEPPPYGTPAVGLARAVGLNGKQSVAIQFRINNKFFNKFLGQGLLAVDVRGTLPLETVSLFADAPAKTSWLGSNSAYKYAVTIEFDIEAANLKQFFPALPFDVVPGLELHLLLETRPGQGTRLNAYQVNLIGDVSVRDFKSWSLFTGTDLSNLNNYFRTVMLDSSLLQNADKLNVLNLFQSVFSANGAGGQRTMAQLLAGTPLENMTPQDVFDRYFDADSIVFDSLKDIIRNDRTLIHDLRNRIKADVIRPSPGWETFNQFINRGAVLELSIGTSFINPELVDNLPFRSQKSLVFPYVMSNVDLVTLLSTGVASTYKISPDSAGDSKWQIGLTMLRAQSNWGAGIQWGYQQKVRNWMFTTAGREAVNGLFSAHSSN